ncbi:MAG: DUF6445 family protein [Pseudomonadota bacterium]|nr:DUF6445 family protein [Pseudomonadota bacterium]
MEEFGNSLTSASEKTIGNERTKIVEIAEFFTDPEAVCAASQTKQFAQINPHYPGIRAEVEPGLLDVLCASVSEMASQHLGQAKYTWQGQAWYSIVTQPAQSLTPIQRLPHFDGFDEAQLAVMIYLGQTPHGGTAFYRQRSTGFERVTQARYPEYKTHLEAGVRQTGLPPAAYISDGAPLFEKVYESDGVFNSLILYPGTSLHSGVIRNDRPLSADPGLGRLTINGFFRPA